MSSSVIYTPRPKHVLNPQSGDKIYSGQTVEFDFKTSSVVYRANKTFTFTDILNAANVSDFALNFVTEKDRFNSFFNSHSEFENPFPEIDFYVENGEYKSSVSEIESFKSEFGVDSENVYYLDNVNGSNSNDGSDAANAKETWAGIRSTISGLSLDSVKIIIINSGKAYDNLSGISHVASQMAVNTLVVEGVKNSVGLAPCLGWIYAASDYGSVTAHSTLSGVWDIDITGLSLFENICSISHTEKVGPKKNKIVPRKYEVCGSENELDSSKGGIFIDGNTLRVKTFDGLIPVIGESLVAQRNALTGSSMATGGKISFEDICFIGENVLGNATEIVIINCKSVYSSLNAFAPSSHKKAVFFKPFAYDCFNDGFNDHNIGSNVTSISTANPAVVTFSGGSNFKDGDTVEVIGSSDYEGLEFVIDNVTGTTLELKGFLGIAVSGSVKVRHTKSVSLYISPEGENIGNKINLASSNQAFTIHENCESVVVDADIKDCARNFVVDTGSGSRYFVGGKFDGLYGTSDTTLTTSRIPVLTTGSVKLFMDKVKFEGFFEPLNYYVQTNGNSKVRYTDMTFINSKRLNGDVERF